MATKHAVKTEEDFDLKLFFIKVKPWVGIVLALTIQFMFGGIVAGIATIVLIASIVLMIRKIIWKARLKKKQ